MKDENLFKRRRLYKEESKMRSPSTIRRQIEHFRTSCESDQQTRDTWIAALEWVLDGAHSSLGLRATAAAAVAALRSYQHGNSAPDLAKEVADKLEAAIVEEML